MKNMIFTLKNKQYIMFTYCHLFRYLDGITTWNKIYDIFIVTFVDDFVDALQYKGNIERPNSKLWQFMMNFLRDVH